MTTLIAPRPAVKATRPGASRPAAIDGPASPEAGGFAWEIGPDAADDRWHAEHNTDWHTDEPTPDNVRTPPAPSDADELAEAGPDWDALADESAAPDRLCAGCLL